MKKTIIFILLAITLNASSQVKSVFVQTVEKAVADEKFHKNELVSFDIDLMFGGKNTLKGHVISATNSSAIKLIKEDGTVVVFDGEKVWITPKVKNNARARFDIFTWQYFFMAPFKMSDNGTKWADLGSQKYNATQNYDTGSVVF